MIWMYNRLSHKATSKLKFDLYFDFGYFLRSVSLPSLYKDESACGHEQFLESLFGIQEKYLMHVHAMLLTVTKWVVFLRGSIS